MLERTVFDPDTGQLLTGSLADCCLAPAEGLPAIGSAYNLAPCRTNPLGVKGAGEACAIGPPPALVNAVADPPTERGIEHFDTPLTRGRLWRVIGVAEQRKAL
jgi:aerobic carbon-monoxide dehydrogenase large subunit